MRPVRPPEDDRGDLEVTTPLGKITGHNVRTSELLSILILVIVALTFWMVLEHKADARDNAAIISSSNKEVASAIRDFAQSNRKLTCVISLPQEQRQVEYLIRACAEGAR